ncbi:MAG: DUF4340 domain-containing protein [Clostridia bacterium]|nr:DUF4340 domain-containing protein [Clostridia bacterium]
MTNLPENENQQPIDEFSTVFSDPTEHKKTANTNKGKRLKVVISLVLAVAVLLGGTFAIVKLIPEKEDEQPVVDQEISVLSYDSDEIKGVAIKNKNDSFKIYSETVKEKATAEDEEPTTATYWYLKGYDKDLTDSDLILQAVNSAIDFTAIREIASKSAKECGLDSPEITVDITTNKDEKVSFSIGAQSPDNAGVYVKASNKDTIYLVGGDIYESLSFSALDMANTEAQPAITLDDDYSDYYEGEQLTKFDKISISGKNFPQELVFVPNSDELFSQFMPYKVLKPVERDAANVDSLFYVFSQGFNVSGAYSYDVSSKTISSFGLNKPDLVLSARFDDLTYTYKFKQQKDGDFAFICNDSKNVRRVSTSDCAFLISSTADYYNETLLLVSIDEVKNLSFETEDKTYNFSVKANEKEDDTNKYIVKCDGKTYKSAYFQSFYQYLCSLQAMDFSVDDTSSKPELTITYSYNKKNKAPTKIEFVKTSATKYQYSINGIGMGKISSSSVKKITKNLQRLLEGKSITVN